MAHARNHSCAVDNMVQTARGGVGVSAVIVFFLTIKKFYCLLYCRTATRRASPTLLFPISQILVVSTDPQ